MRARVVQAAGRAALRATGASRRSAWSSRESDREDEMGRGLPRIGVALRASRARWLFALALMAPLPLAAQLTTDEVPRERTIASQDQVKSVLEKSRFRLGPFRLIPFLRISEAGYTDNALGTSDAVPKKEDYFGSVQGGVRWAIPAGAKLYVQGEIRPAYDYSVNFPERRTFGGLYEAELLGFFNRMSFSVAGYNTRGVEYLNSETDTQVIHTVRDGTGKVEIDLTRKVSLFGNVEAQRHRYGFGGPLPTLPPGTIFDVSLLNRDEAAVRGGLRFRFSPSFDITAEVEGTRTEFSLSSRKGDNQSTAYLLGVHYDRPRFFVNLSGGYREGRPYNDSLFPSFSTPTGSYFASYFLTRKVELQAYGGRRLVYGLFFDNPYYIENQAGGAVAFHVSPRLLLRGFGDYGENDSPLPVLFQGALVKNKERVTNYGGGFSTTFFRTMSFSLNAYRTRFRSNIDVFSRSTTRVTAALTLLGD